MSAPVPKPRTKFGGGENQNDTEQNPCSSTSPPPPPPPQKPENPEVVTLRKSEDLDVIIPKSPSPPPIPPRPPAKPPRAAGMATNQTVFQNFGSVLGELRLNLGEVTSSGSSGGPSPRITSSELPTSSEIPGATSPRTTSIGNPGATSSGSSGVPSPRVTSSEVPGGTSSGSSGALSSELPGVTSSGAPGAPSPRSTSSGAPEAGHSGITSPEVPTVTSSGPSGAPSSRVTSSGVPGGPSPRSLRPSYYPVTSSESQDSQNSPKPPQIGFMEDPNPNMSPPMKQAPPPPRPPPPAGWKPDVGQKPLIPERVTSHSNRPLPAIPIDFEMSPPQSGTSTGPSSSSSSNFNQTTHQMYPIVPQTVENPLYLTLDNYRSISGITPSPSGPPTRSPDCEELREWLTEEEEAETELHQRPEDLNMSGTSTSSEFPHENENPYTPCPRRSDYSNLEFVGTHSDPFDDDFFNTSSTSSGQKNQNLYVSPQFEKKNHEDVYENVVETCAPEDVVVQQHREYVNVPPPTHSDDVDEWGLKVEKGGKMKIDGSTVSFVGFVNLISSKKEKRLHLRLRHMQLSFHEDDESEDVQNGPFDIKDIYLFRQITNTDGNGLQSSSILLHIGEKRTVIQFHPEEPSNLWMFMISEAWLSLNYTLTTALRDADELEICGNVWIKHGTTGEWRNCSTGINRMTLYYMFSEARDRILHRNSTHEDLVNVDLRKIMTMREKIDKTEFCPNVKHKRGPFSITLHGVTLYIDSRDESTTSHWFEAIESLLKRPATRLENLRLTADNIPVVVDKCIRFVSAYGMKSEGIYRRNGKVTEAKTIMAKLIEDPVGYYPVQENDETVYAVADVLRQFFRKLDEPLFPSTSQAELFELALELQSDALWSQYVELIEQLPTVHHATLKKLIGHLKNVSEHSTENRASVENLAKVFAASLFMTDSMEGKVFSDTYNQQINIMIHLITGYDTIFQISYQEELSRQMVNDAEKKSVNAKKPSSDVIIAIHVWEKENRPFNVIMSLASQEVIREAIVKRGFDGPIDSQYAIFECISNGHLMRRLSNSTKMSKCVFQWIDWTCKDGFLLFDHDKYKFNGNDMSCFTGKVKVAEPTSKTFKSYEVKIENGTSIVAFRNEKPWKSWALDEVLWYVGTEPSRKPPNTWNCTMIPISKDSYTSKFPGFCFSFKEEVERSRWMTALTHFTKNDDSEPLVYI